MMISKNKFMYQLCEDFMESIADKPNVLKFVKYVVFPLAFILITLSMFIGSSDGRRR